MTISEIAKKYCVSPRTAKRYRKLNAPVDDEPTMRGWIESHHSRSGVGKYTPRTETPSPIAPVRVVTAEIVPVEHEEVAAPVATDDVGTLQRLEQAERIAYKRFLDSGGSERAGQLWLLCADQLRKTRDSAAKLANDVTEGETRFIGTCAEIILELKQLLEASPTILSVLCEGLDRDAIAPKIADHIRGTLRHAAKSLASQLKGTSLEAWFQPD